MEHMKGASLRQAPDLTQKHQTWLERLPRDKHSGLWCNLRLQKVLKHLPRSTNVGRLWICSQILDLDVCCSINHKYLLSKKFLMKKLLQGKVLGSISQNFLVVNLLTLFCKLDLFIFNVINIAHVYKRVQLTKRSSKCALKQFYEIDPQGFSM